MQKLLAPADRRQVVNFSLAPELIQEIRERSLVTGVPQSRIVENALRTVLGLLPLHEAPAATTP